MGRTATYVLLVEQDPVRGDLLQGFLEEAGYRVYHAQDADEALAMLGDDPSIAGLVTTYELPEINGMKLIRRILKNGDFEGGVVLYDCPKPRLAEERLEEWTDGEIDFIVLEAPSDAEHVVDGLGDVLGIDDEVDDF